MQRYLRKHVLWIPLAAVLLPLGVLLGMQYVWLVDLEKKSALAHEAYLKNYLEAISGKVEHFYLTQAERGLNLPGYLFTEGKLHKVPYYFKKKKVEGASLLFVVDFANERDWGSITYFDPAKETVGVPEDPSLARSVSVALAPWKAICRKGAPLKSHGIVVEEIDPSRPILLNPVTDDGCRPVGLVGMVVDVDHFQKAVLPGAVEAALYKFFGEEARDSVIVTARDGWGRVVLGPEEEAEAPAALAENGKDEASAETMTGRIPFIFSDYTLQLSAGASPEEWARSNFALNITMSALLALALLGGIVLALRMASREIKLSAMKSDFVSNVSHELRTPLASIRVFGEFLRLGRVKSEPKIREYGEYIETESRRLTQLINNILDFSKIESGAKTYEFEPTQVDGVVADTLKTMEVGLKHRGFQLEFEPPQTRLPPVHADADAIAQAVANLVDNAVKYSNGRSEIQVKLGRDNGEVTIAVQDHGIGISREEQSKIFERFHRVSTGLVHDVKGSGLGLAIVTHIVNAHGGKIRVDSEPGRGSTFTIHLPVRPVESPAEVGDFAGDHGVGHLEKT